MVKNDQKWRKISKNDQIRENPDFLKISGRLIKIENFIIKKLKNPKKIEKSEIFENSQKCQIRPKFSVQKSGFYNVFSSQTRIFCPARPMKIGQKSTITS